MGKQPHPNLVNPYRVKFCNIKAEYMLTKRGSQKGRVLIIDTKPNSQDSQDIK